MHQKPFRRGLSRLVGYDMRLGAGLSRGGGVLIGEAILQVGGSGFWQHVKYRSAPCYTKQQNI